jgi:tight adherence protein B
VKRRVAAATLAALLLPAAASASVVFRAVDTSAYPRVRVTVVTSKPTSVPPSLEEEGVAVADLEAANLGKEKSVVLAIDRSHSMAGRALRDAVASARAFIRARQPGDRVAIVIFGSQTRRLTGFTASSSVADEALRSLKVDGHQGTALYDAISMSALLLAGERNRGRVIVLVTDGRDVSSSSTLQAAVESARQAGVSVYPVAILSSQFTPDALQRIARGTAGIYRSVTSTSSLSSIYTSIADELRRTWQLEYLTAGRPGESLALKVAVPGLGAAEQQLILQSDAGGKSQPSLMPAYFFTGRGIAALASIVALLGFVAAAILLATFRQGWLRGMLAPHVGTRSKAPVKRKTRRERLEALAGLFRVTEHIFSHTKLWRRLTKLIERADLSLKTVELVYLSLAACMGLGFFVSLLGMSGLPVLVAFLVGGSAPVAFVMYKARRRVAAFDDQLPDLLASVAASLKAGHSFKSALQSIVDEGAEPASKELRRVIAETRLGRPIEDALGEMATRLGSSNFEFIVTAVNIQTQVGGSLAGLFDLVSDTIRQRHGFARKIKSLTAMGRMSAYVLVGLPVFLAMCLTLLSRDYMAPLWNSSAGHKLIGVGVVMMMIGASILRKIVSFKG